MTPEQYNLEEMLSEINESKKKDYAAVGGISSAISGAGFMGRDIFGYMSKLVSERNPAKLIGGTIEIALIIAIMAGIGAGVGFLIGLLEDKGINKSKIKKAVEELKRKYKEKKESRK